MKGTDGMKQAFRTEEEAEQFFYGFSNHFWDLGLDNLHAFLAYFEHPQDKLPVVQVAGTNGKGSVSTYLAEIAIQSGLKVGVFNSPAVFEKRENISINHRSLRGDAFIEMVTMLKPAMELADKQGVLPTLFELETALAYLWFWKEDCDLVLMECGLGGKTDATNVTNATFLSILTSISMDHMQYLGNTLDEIAACKCGIIKNGISVVSAAQKEEAASVIRRIAQEQQAELTFVKPEQLKRIRESLFEECFQYPDSEHCYVTGMAGVHQAENAALAIEAAHILQRKGYPITEDAIQTGLRQARIPGRFEVLKDRKPLMLLDGAHNPDAAYRLRENILSSLSGYYLIFIMGVFADKDYQAIIRNTCDLADEIYAVRAGGTRALPAHELARAIQKEWKHCTVYTAELKAALNAARQTDGCGKPVAIIVFGSFSYLQQVKEIIEEEEQTDEN